MRDHEQRNGRLNTQQLRPRKDLNLPLDARPRRTHQERLAAWGLPGGVPRDRLPVPDDAARRGGGATEHATRARDGRGGGRRPRPRRAGVLPGSPRRCSASPRRGSGRAPSTCSPTTTTAASCLKQIGPCVGKQTVLAAWAVKQIVLVAWAVMLVSLDYMITSYM